MSEVVVAAAPRLLHRQRLLLSLLRAFGGEMRDCDFQRLLFRMETQEYQANAESNPLPTPDPAPGSVQIATATSVTFPWAGTTFE